SHQLAGGGAAVETQIERHLVVSRAAGMQCSAGGSEVCQSALDGGVDVLVRFEEFETALIDLAMDRSKALLDCPQGRGLQESRRVQPGRVGEAPGDVMGL